MGTGEAAVNKIIIKVSPKNTVKSPNIIAPAEYRNCLSKYCDKGYSTQSDFGKRWVDGTIEAPSVHIRTLDSSQETPLQNGANINISLVL